MWKLTDIDPSVDYVVQLCHDNDNGRRSFKLRKLNLEEAHKDSVFETLVVPHELLKTRNIKRIADKIRLNSDESFWVDAHGIWLTQEELAALEDDIEVPWATSTPPVFAPR